MNKELIQKFLNKACWDEQAQHELEDWLNVEKFAELIIRECVAQCKKNVDHEYLGWGSRLSASNIKEHFGVEE